MAERYIPEHRRTQFKAKNTFKPEELRRRREEQQVEIRKAKREENLAKRRGIGSGENRPGASLGAEADSDDDTAPTESQVSLSYPSALYAPYCYVQEMGLFASGWLAPRLLPSVYTP
jgi:importin subunit alpha-1